MFIGIEEGYMSLFRELQSDMYQLEIDRGPYFIKFIHTYCRNIIENYDNETIKNEFVLEVDKDSFDDGFILTFNEGHILSGLLYSKRLWDKCLTSYYKLNPHRYSDELPYSKRRFWYFTTHGIGPGTIPKDLTLLEVKEGKNKKGTKGDFILLDGVLNTDELKLYDLIEDIPQD